MKKLCLITATIALLVSGVAAWALPTTQLYDVGGTYVTVTPSYTVSGGVYSYLYDLTNTTSDSITAFTLVFPTAVPVASLSGIFGPAGWSGLPKNSGNKINWLALNDPSAIAPSTTGTFGFSCKFGPSAQMAATSRGQLAYTGITYGPVPEPASLSVLAIGLSGLLSLALRKRTR